MFDLCVLPTLREHYNPNSHHFKRLCRRFADKLGLPKEQWARVTLPFFISLDHDTRHCHVRKTLLTPRYSLAAIESERRKAIANHFEVPAAKRPCASASQLEQGRQLLANAAQEQQVLHQLQAYAVQYGVDFWQLRMWELALTQPGWCCLLPQQYMPLSKVSPDLHCVVEHMVGTVKHGVREELLDMDLNDESMWVGSTYQVVIDKVVSSRGQGERGVHHVSRSVEKWPHVAAILAADQNEVLTLKYVFGDGGENESGRKTCEHEVRGTAGDYIRDTKWT